MHPSAVNVVIRATGERTEYLCRQLVIAQLPEECVVTISERPFARALQRGIEVAIAKKARWSIFLDADILLGATAIQRMVAEMERAPETAYMMNFQLMDRGFCGPAYGVHCYNSEYLPLAMRFMEKAWRDQRPETRLYKEMAGQGYPTLLSRTIVGLHDYEQYYRDLYRKMFVRAIKYEGQVEFMMQTFRTRYQNDDYKVMMWGLVDGVFHKRAGNDKASLDVEFYRSRSADVLGMLNIREKPPMEESVAISPDDIIASTTLDDHYRANQYWIAPVQSQAVGFRRQPLWGRVRSKFKSVLK